MKINKLLVIGIVGLCSFLLIPSPTQALTIPVEFDRITYNNTENVADQLLLTIYDPDEANSTFGANLVGTNQALFVFSNNVGIASNISDIYIDDGIIVGQSSILNSLGGYTLFTAGANPGNLPSGKNLEPDFDATSDFSADSQVLADGINSSSDKLGIIYDLKADFSDIMTALNDGTLRIGLHVRSIGTAGGSDSFVNHVPDASIMFLLGPALIALGIFSRRKQPR